MSIKIENVEVVGWEHAIRGMRNPKNSWDRSDGYICKFGTSAECLDKSCEYLYEMDGEFSWCTQPYKIGPNDHKLMMNLAKGGPVHAKYRRMIVVYADIVAPLFWWKEFDTYKIGVVRNSCSTMHKIHVKEFTIDDFSHEGIDAVEEIMPGLKDNYETYIGYLEALRQRFNETQDKRYWRALIEMLPDGYLMRSTIMTDYEVLHNQYFSREGHKLFEWDPDYRKFIESLPYSEIITQPVFSPDKELLDKLLAGEISVNEAREKQGLEPIKEPEFLNKKFNIPKYEVCPECGGAGLICYEPDSSKLAICHVCHGEKVVRA